MESLSRTRSRLSYFGAPAPAIETALRFSLRGVDRRSEDGRSPGVNPRGQTGEDRFHFCRDLARTCQLDRYIFAPRFVAFGSILVSYQRRLCHPFGATRSFRNPRLVSVVPSASMSSPIPWGRLGSKHSRFGNSLHGKPAFGSRSRKQEYPCEQQPSARSRPGLTADPPTSVPSL